MRDCRFYYHNKLKNALKNREFNDDYSDEGVIGFEARTSDAC